MIFGKRHVLLLWLFIGHSNSLLCMEGETTTVYLGDEEHNDSAITTLNDLPCDQVFVVSVIAANWGGSLEDLRACLLSFVAGSLPQHDPVFLRLHAFIHNSDCTFKSLSALQDTIYRNKNSRGWRLLWRPRGAIHCKQLQGEELHIRRRIPFNEVFMCFLNTDRRKDYTASCLKFAIENLIKADVVNQSYSPEFGDDLKILFKNYFSSMDDGLTLFDNRAEISEMARALERAANSSLLSFISNIGEVKAIKLSELSNYDAYKKIIFWVLFDIAFSSGMLSLACNP